MAAKYKVLTNKVWKGMVAYREQYVKEALAGRRDLLCTCEGVMDVMTIPFEKITERILHYSEPQYRDARTGKYDQRLAYFWWWPDGRKFEPKTDPNAPKQQTLFS